jgi:hypothetical protein
MKIRNGFVSNSSTSSFLIIGFMVDEDKAMGVFDEQEFFEFAKKHFKNIKSLDELKKHELEEVKQEFLYHINNMNSHIKIISNCNSEYGFLEDKVMIGIKKEVSAESDDFSLDWNGLKAILKPVAEKLNSSFPEDVLIITGTEAN